MSRAFGVLRTWISKGIRDGQSQAFRDQRHIIIDMDETLLHTFETRQSLKNLRLFSTPRLIGLRSRIFVLDSGIWGATRPHLGNFIEASFGAFSTVTIWSAGEAGYVNEVVKHIFRGLPKPDLVMTREDCATDLIEISEDGKEDRLYQKPLYVAREYHERLSPGVHMTEANTLIIEDRPSAVAFEDRFNSVLVPAYTPAPTSEALMRKDETLKTLADWFAQDRFRTASDLRSVTRPILYAVPVPKSIVRADYATRRPVGYTAS